MTEQICRALVDPTGKITYESAVAIGSTLQQIIEDDKKYGVMVPYNGKYFTIKVFDWKNRWMNSKQITKGIQLAWNTVEKVIDIDVRFAKEGEYVDFKVFFRSTADDPLLTNNTLQYHYYPISDFQNPKRGVCVVNIDFDWTIDGKGINHNDYDPENHREVFPHGSVKTYDFDDIYVHEGPGHGLGLPHSPNRYTKMFGSESGMIDSIFKEKPRETIPRLRAKYPKKKISIWHLWRWARYYLRRRDHY